jgi:hypothetical protein
VARSDSEGPGKQPPIRRSLPSLLVKFTTATKTTTTTTSTTTSKTTTITMIDGNPPGGFFFSILLLLLLTYFLFQRQCSSRLPQRPRQPHRNNQRQHSTVVPRADDDQRGSRRLRLEPQVCFLIFSFFNTVLKLPYSYIAPTWHATTTNGPETRLGPLV